LKSIFLHTIR